MIEVFISYSHCDIDFVSYLEARLKSEIGRVKIIRDVNERFTDLLSILEPTSNYYIPIITKSFIESSMCGHELDNALIGYLQNGKPKILPVISDDFAITNAPSKIKKYRYYKLLKHSLTCSINTRERNEFDSNYKSLISVIQESPLENDFFRFNHPSWQFSPSNELEIKNMAQEIELCARNSRINTAVVLTFNDWIDLSGYRVIVVKVKGVNNCNFDGWSTQHPKMFKIEFDGESIEPEKEDQTVDDKNYVKPIEKTFNFKLPVKFAKEGIRKIEMVIGPGTIKMLTIAMGFCR